MTKTYSKKIEASDQLAPQISKLLNSHNYNTETGTGESEAKEYFEIEMQMYSQEVSKYLACLDAKKEYPFSEELLINAIHELYIKGRFHSLYILGMTDGHKLTLELLLYDHLDDPIEQVQLRTEIEREYQLYGRAFDRALQAYRQKTGKTSAPTEESYSAPTKKQDTDWADEIADIHRDSLAWDDTAKQWRQYGLKTNGVWDVLSETKLISIIKTYIQSQGKGCSAGKISSIEKLLRANLYVNDWYEHFEFIPFADGIYHRKTQSLEPHSPAYKMTWQLPHPYHSESDSWEKINEWLDEATQGNQQHKNKLIAFLNAILTGRSDLQKFLSLEGLGGSGKGTFIRLACDLIGPRNVHSSTLKDWTGNRFEPANGYKKRLIIFSDEQGKHKDIGNFLKLTGQDYIRAEEKGKQAFHYKFGGMVITASNGPLFPGVSSSALNRRQILLPFNALIPGHLRRDLNAEFQVQLPALTRYLLSLPNEWVTQTLQGDSHQSITPETWENRMRDGGLASWLNDWVIHDDAQKTPIGSKKASDHDNQDECITLYQSYTLYCAHGNYHPKAFRNFSADLIELCNAVLGWDVEKKHDRNCNVIGGLRLRHSKLDEQLPTIEEAIGANPNQPIEAISTPVEDSVEDCGGCVEDSVEDRTHTQQGCGGCGGNLATFSQENNSPPVGSRLAPPENHIQIATPLPEEHDREIQQKRSLVAESTKQIKELKRSCYPSMSDDEYRDRFRNLLSTLYGVPDRSQMTLEQLQDFISTLVFWNRQGAKFKPQGWELKTNVDRQYD